MTFSTLRTTLMAGVFAAAATPLAIAQQVAPPAAENAAAPMPFAQPDNSWITISGTVMSPTEQTFLLDYGGGQIIVEMDDWNGWSEAMNLTEGHEVTVTGRVDDDLLETASIEASAVIDRVTDQHFFASEADEEDLVDWFATESAAAGQTTMRGAVKSVSVEEGEFILDNGVFEVQVDIGKLDANPLDADGALQISAGDIVTVSGVVEKDLFEAREIQAKAINVLTPDKIRLETSAGLRPDAAPAPQQLADNVPGAPPAQGEAWSEGRNKAPPHAYTGAAVAESTQVARVETSASVTATEVDTSVMLPAEVEMAAEKDGYTTEDLAKAQLAALRSAPPLNPS